MKEGVIASLGADFRSSQTEMFTLKCIVSLYNELYHDLSGESVHLRMCFLSFQRRAVFKVERPH